MILHFSSAVELLKELIATPSFSREERETAQIIKNFFKQKSIFVEEKGNNIWVKTQHFDPTNPTLLLNSHHDTVRPADGWTYSPFIPHIEGDYLYGLGSNDAGGPLISLMLTFLHFYAQTDLPVNLIFAATAEEEISGANGIVSILDELGSIELGIVGEPTQMRMAIAEKGLMVLDCTAFGQTGHAAREEGINAIYKAITDIEWFRTYAFEKVSPLLGPIKMSVTQIESGIQHNVVPDSCRYVVDVRSNECYTNQAIFEIICKHVSSEVEARSFRLNSSGIPLEHPLVQAGLQIALPYYGSPTLSDQALMPFPTLKIGPGASARSHTPNEYIGLSEIETGTQTYIQLLNTYFKMLGF